jgi:predicted regulator of Ras-like GTPase activity (Roadblock/LC7/MglB family)
MKITKEMESALDRVRAAMIVDYNRFMCADPREAHVDEMREEFAAAIIYEVGNKYIKISKGGSVHSFVVNTDKDKKFAYGDILKTASWAAPARNFKRGNIFETENIEKVITWTGV